MRTRLLAAAIVSAVVAGSLLAETLPPSPTRYFNDYAGVARIETAERLNRQLEEFERASSSQIVVAVFRKMDTASSVEDFSQRVFDAWKPGRAKLDNGALLLVFLDDRKMRIHTGYGLEGALPDVTAKRIIEEEIAPRFRAGDYDGGLSAGVSAMIAASRGEYRGTGRTVADRQGSGSPGVTVLIYIIFAVLIVVTSLRRRTRTVYYPWGRRTQTYWDFSGGSSGGWGGSSGGGGFSGGGGRSGGGGASGSW